MSLKKTAPSVLIVCYSFSSQTRRLVEKIAEGLDDMGVHIFVQRLEVKNPPSFPLHSIFKTIKMMLTTFLRKRFPIRPLSEKAFEDYDLVIIAGPTWSYNPSGPILSFLDQYGEKILEGKRVIALISCRKYWRTHAWYLKKRILAAGGIPEPPLYYNHPVSDPWNLIGVFLTIAGRSPRKIPVMKKYYTRYGHSSNQLDMVKRDGEKIAARLLEKY